MKQGILPILDDLPGGRPVKLKLSESPDEEAFGVEWRSVTFNGRRLVNIVNYNKQAVSIIPEGISTTDRIDLITNTEVGQVLTIDPLEIYLISAL